MTDHGKALQDGRAPGPEDIASVEELLAHAYYIEVDANERYLMLADQMDVHNNPELAELFRKLASHEEHHAQEILEQAGGRELPRLTVAELKWGDVESPEAATLDQAHYLMTPWHALQMALAAEERAYYFFDRIVTAATDPEMRKWAEEFREEEAEHIRLVKDLLARHPKPADDWDEDPDPPIYPE